jgi:acylphosphatase
MDILRIVWAPVNEDDKIHGIRLRETVKAVAEKFSPPITGEVQNIDQNRVEMIFQCNPDFLVPFLDKIQNAVQKISQIGIKVERQDTVNDLKKWKKFDGMRVIRGDSLAEIDLAIQGAERIFRNVHEEIRSLWETRQWQRLKGVEREVTKMRGLLDTPAGQKMIHTYVPHAIHNFLAQPFDPRLSEVCDEIDQLYITNGMNGRLSFNQDELKKFAELLEKALLVIEEVKEKQGWERNIKQETEGK